MPELVICNTSPLFYLHRLRQLELLQKLYERIVVPRAVVQDLNAGRGGRSRRKSPRERVGLREILVST